MLIGVKKSRRLSRHLTHKLGNNNPILLDRGQAARLFAPLYNFVKPDPSYRYYMYRAQTELALVWSGVRINELYNLAAEEVRLDLNLILVGQAAIPIQPESLGPLHRWIKEQRRWRGQVSNLLTTYRGLSADKLAPVHSYFYRFRRHTRMMLDDTVLLRQDVYSSYLANLLLDNPYMTFTEFGKVTRSPSVKPYYNARRWARLLAERS